MHIPSLVADEDLFSCCCDEVPLCVSVDVDATSTVVVRRGATFSPARPRLPLLPLLG